jgi:hypothetical protein
MVEVEPLIDMELTKTQLSIPQQIDMNDGFNIAITSSAETLESSSKVIGVGSVFGNIFLNMSMKKLL